MVKAASPREIMETVSYQNNLPATAPQPEIQRLPLRLLLAYGVGHVLNDVCASMWFTYLLVFFHFVLQFDNWEAGFLLLVGQIADALATPFVGFQSDLVDDYWFCRYGRRKTWHLVGSICVLGTFPFIFSKCVNCGDSPKSAQLFYYSVFIVIFQFGWASVQISHLSLIPELTPDEHDRTKLTAIRYSFTVFSNVLVYVITWLVLHLEGASDNTQIGPNDVEKFETVVWIGLSVGLLCTLIFHLFVSEDDRTIADSHPHEVRSGVGRLLCTIQVYQVAGVYMATRLFVNLSQVFIPLYLHETLNMVARALAVVPLTMFLSSFVVSLLLEVLNRRLGRKVSYIIGAIIGVTACIWVQLRSGSDFVNHEIYGVAVLFGASGSIILVTSLGITADLIGKNTRNGAFVYGVMSFTDKLANGVAVIIIQNMRSFNSDITYYRDILTYVCGGAIIIGSLFILSLIRSHRDTTEYVVIADSGDFLPATQQTTNSIQNHRQEIVF